MSKTKTEDANGSPVDESLKSSSIDELKKNGTIILSATSRAELFVKFNELKASSKDVTLMTGAAGRKDDGTFTLQVDLQKS